MPTTGDFVAGVLAALAYTAAGWWLHVAWLWWVRRRRGPEIYVGGRIPRDVLPDEAVGDISDLPRED